MKAAFPTADYFSHLVATSHTATPTMFYLCENVIWCRNVRLCIWVHYCVFARLCALLCLCVFVHIIVCICTFVYIIVRVFVHIVVCMCICARYCDYVYLGFCALLCACVLVSLCALCVFITWIELPQVIKVTIQSSVVASKNVQLSIICNWIRNIYINMFSSNTIHILFLLLNVLLFYCMLLVL